MQDSLQKVHAQSNAYTSTKIRLDKGKLEKDILPQIEDVFLNASKMIITLRDHMEDLIIKGHRIESLEGRNLSELPGNMCVFVRAFLHTYTRKSHNIFLWGRPSTTGGRPALVPKSLRVFVCRKTKTKRQAHT